MMLRQLPPEEIKKMVKTDFKNYYSTKGNTETLTGYFNLAQTILTAQAVAKAYL